MTNIFQAFRDYKRAHANPWAEPTEPAGPWRVEDALSGPEPAAPPEQRVRARRSLYWRNDPTPPLLRAPPERRREQVAQLRAEHPELFPTPPELFPPTSEEAEKAGVSERPPYVVDWSAPLVLSEAARKIFRERSR